MFVIKKDKSIENFDFNKIKYAVIKSAKQIGEEVNDNDFKNLENDINEHLSKKNINKISVSDIHLLVINKLKKINKNISNSYKSYRIFKIDNENMFDELKRDSDFIMYDVDRENANSNSSLISTKKSLMAGKTLSTLYKKYFLTKEENEAINEGFIYIHDSSDRYLASINCCLFDLETVMKNGFTMNNLEYTEPTTILSACNVTGDIIMASSAQQYGGHTTPEIDKTLSYYCEKSYKNYFEKIYKFYKKHNLNLNEEEISKEAINETYKELKQGIQSLEVKLNTVVSARGSFPFTTFTFGNDKSFWATMVSKAILEVRKNGQGKNNKIQIFPKLVFLYRDELHNEGMPLEWLFDEAVECSKKAMYPDYLSQKYHYRENKWVSPMGCRAYLSDYRDENGELHFIGRGNIGAISLNLPIIYMYSIKNNKLFLSCLITI